MNTNIANYNHSKYTRDKASGMLTPGPYHFMTNQPNKENAIGYCHNIKHLGYLSEAIISQHQCVQKGCKYFSKYDDKEYWQEKDKDKKQKKISARLNKKIMLENIKEVYIDGKRFAVDSDKKKTLNLIKEQNVVSMEQIKFKNEQIPSNNDYIINECTDNEFVEHFELLKAKREEIFEIKEKINDKQEKIKLLNKEINDDKNKIKDLKNTKEWKEILNYYSALKKQKKIIEMPNDKNNYEVVMNEDTDASSADIMSILMLEIIKMA